MFNPKNAMKKMLGTKKPTMNCKLDYDGDGLANYKDCSPLNKRKQGPQHWRKVTKADYDNQFIMWDNFGSNLIEAYVKQDGNGNVWMIGNFYTPGLEFKRGIDSDTLFGVFYGKMQNSWRPWEKGRVSGVGGEYFMNGSDTKIFKGFGKFRYDKNGTGYDYNKQLRLNVEEVKKANAFMRNLLNKY